MTERTVPVTGARTRLTEILDMVEREPLTLTKDGRPIAVVMNPDHYGSMVATLELLGDPVARARIDEVMAEQRDRSIEYLPHTEVELLLRGARSRG